MNEDKNEKYIEFIVTIGTLLFFALLSTYAMRGCSDNKLVDENLVAVHGIPLSESTSNTDKERKDAVKLMDEPDEVDEVCDDGSQVAVEEESTELNSSVEILVQEELSVEASTNTTIPVIEVVQAEVKEVESTKKEAVKTEEKASIITDIENGRISKSPYILEGVSFKMGSSILTKTSKKQVDAIANALKKHKNVNINLRGHTDNTGSTKDNEKLSTKRADSVGFALVDRGVDINNIWIQGMGELDPRIKNGTAEEMAKNRRVDIAVIE